MGTALSIKERDILRRLVGEYMGAATLPVQGEKTGLWKALNRSEMVRPMVTMDQLPWNELDCAELRVQIKDPYWVGVEARLRRTLYQWNNFPVDMVLDSAIAIPKALELTGYGICPSSEKLGAKDSTAPSHHYRNQIETLEDVAKIQDYHVRHDERRTELHLAEARELFGDMAPVRAVGTGFHLGVWDYLSMLMGVQDIYFAFIDEPELLHAAMERLTQATLCAIDEADACGGHNDNANSCHCSHIYTDELLPGSGEGRGPLAKNCWAFGMAQLFTSVSPELFEEFEFPYISRMAQRFGGIYYGCCERLDDRLDMVKRIPNVRKISCSPWSDRERFAQEIGEKLILSNKPTPAYLAGASFDEGVVERDLRRTCELAAQNHVNVEFLLKDVSTVNGDPGRLRRWAEIAMRVVNDV